MNNVVFEYDDYRQCCEYWDWGVYAPETGEKVADDPNGLPYHFDYVAGAIEDAERTYTDMQEYANETVQVTLVHDENPDKRLVFECFNCHNGWYYHDFSFKRLGEEKKA